MNIAGHHSMMAGAPPDDPTIWIDGKYLDAPIDSSSEVVHDEAGSSYCEIYIPRDPSHRFSCYFGYHPNGGRYKVLLYKTDKSLNGYTTPAQYGSPVRLGRSAESVYIRISCATSEKTAVYVYDSTDGVYLVKDGKVLTGGGYRLICTRRSYRRSARPSARFWRTSHRWEVAA